ncbi:hypothetical protein JGU66_10245 [Myxococcaceae bacterium JPH2]|nr:hypothetical protein [Myxococcaceae bacterium JPH2]
MAAIVETEKTGFIPATPGTPYKLSWGAILGGAFVALGMWILLYSLGLALGLSSVDPNNPGSARAAGIGTGIWSLLAPLIALFVGGMVASRTAGVVDKAGGALHGAVLWGLTTLAGAVLMGAVLSSLLGAVFSVGKTAVGATGAAVVGVASQGGQAAQAFGLNANDAIAPLNQRLREAGKPTVTAEQLQAATRDVVGDAVRAGHLDREMLVTSIAQKTNLSRADAEDVANRVEDQFNVAQGKAQQVGQQVQHGALKAADQTGHVFWGVFFALLLGLVSAVLGATLGVSKRQRIRAEGVLTATSRREVYP